jgi:hypothetical protein
MQPVTYYDPTSEETNQEQVVATHFEGLRRNLKFREIGRQWVSSEDFRKKHSLTTDYHHPSIHFPRCLLDWLLSAPDRVELFKHQAANLKVFSDVRLNFGPIVLERMFPRHKLRRKNAEGYMRALPLPDAPAPITVDQTWQSVNSQFKEQFRFAVQPPAEFRDMGAWSKEWAKQLGLFAGVLQKEPTPEEIDIMAGHLLDLSSMLHDLSEIYKLVAIPNWTYSRRGMNAVLKQVETIFSSLGQLVSDKKYNAHKSYCCTRDDWRWLLEAEARGLDIRKSADLYELARLYSEHLRQTAPGQRRPNVRTRGFRASSELLRNRRATVRAHVQTVIGWIEKIYPLPAPVR